MNRIFRKVFNAKRGALVAVDETRTGHGQAAGEGVCGCAPDAKTRRAQGSKAQTAAYTVVAAAVAGALMGGMTPAALAEDWTMQGDVSQVYTSYGNSDFEEHFVAGTTTNVVAGGGWKFAKYNADGTINGIRYRDVYVDEGAALNFASADTTLIGRHIKNSGTLTLASQTAFQVQDIEHLGGTLAISASGTANKLVVAAEGASITGGAVHYANGIEVREQGGLAVTGGATTASVYTQTGGTASFGGKNSSGTLLALDGAATVSGGEFVWLGGSTTTTQITAAEGFKLEGGTLTIGGDGSGAAGARWQAAANDAYTSGVIQVKSHGTFQGMSDQATELGTGLTARNAGSMAFDGGLRITGGELIQNSGSADIRASKLFEMTAGTLTIDYPAGDSSTVVRGLQVTDLTQDAVISGGTINSLHGKGLNFSGAANGVKVTGGTINLAATHFEATSTDPAATNTSIEIMGGAFTGGEEIAGKTSYATIAGENDVVIGGAAQFADGNIDVKSTSGRVAFSLDDGNAAKVHDVTSLAQSLRLYGQSNVTASVVATTGGDGTADDIEAGSSLSAEAFQIQGENSVYTNAGTLSAERIAWNDLGQLHQGALVNKGTVNLGTLADQAEGTALKLTMKGANAKLVVADQSFVKNSSIRIEDGAQMNLRDYGLTTLGAGNDYVVENANFSTTLTGDAQHLIAASAFDGMSVLTVDRLTSEGTVILNQGGLLKAGTVALDGATATVHLAGGAIMTSLAGMFEGVTSSTLLITAESPADTADIESQYLGVSTMGNLKSGIAGGIDWQSGTIAFTDAGITTGVITQAVNEIGTAAGAAQANVAVVFTGKIVGGATSADGFTIDTLRGLEAEQAAVAGSAFVNPGIILSGTTLKNTTAAEGARTKFIVAAAEGTDASAYYATQSIGFSKIENAESASVQDGRTLVLTGVERTGADTWKAESAKLLPNGSAVAGTTFSSAGALEALEGSRIQLGTPGLAWQTAGNVGSIAAIGTDAEVKVLNGEFGTVKLTLGNGAAAVIGDTGTLHVDAYALNADGTTRVAGVFTNDGTAGELFGTHETNGASAKSTFQDLTVGAAGVLKVDGGAAEKGGVLTLLAGASHQVANGTSEWQNVKAAADSVITIGASGIYKITSDAAQDLGDFAGTLENSGRFETAQIQAQHTGNFVNKGAHTDQNGVGAFFKNLSVLNGGTHLNDAGAYEEGEDLSLSVGTWTNKGEAHWNALSVTDSTAETSGKLVVGADGFKIALGTFKATGGTVDTSAGKTHIMGGTTSNAARWTAGEVTQEGGVFATAEGGTTTLTNLALSGGTWKNLGAVTGTTLSVTGQGQWMNEATESAQGTEAWQTVSTSGAMTNSGLLTVGTDQTAGSFIATAGTVTNLGTIDLTNVETALYSGAAVANGAEIGEGDADLSVKILYKNLNVAAGTSVNNAYEKGHILTVSDNGSWTNNATAIWDQVFVRNEGAVNNGTLELAKTDAATALTVESAGALTGTGAITGADASVLVEGTLKQGSVSVAALTNKAGAIELGTLKNFGASNTYVHEGASGTVASTDGTFFSGTNLVFTGGGDVHVDATTVGGAADFGGLKDGSGLGANNIVIKGSTNYVLGFAVGDAATTATYGGMTTVYVKTLKDETALDIQAGGRLVTEGLALTGEKKTAKLNGGVLTTGLNSLFESVANKYISIDAVNPETGKVDVTSSILTADSIGALKTAVASGIDFVKGALGFNDPAVSLSVVNAVANAIGTAAGANAQNIDVVFDGRVTNAAGVVGSLTYQDLTDLFTEQAGIDGSPVTNPGIIVGGLDLNASGDADGIVEFGTTGDVKQSIGFKKVTGAEGVNATDGRGTLLGNELAGAIGAEPFNWKDDNRLIETGTAGSGGTVQVGASGRFDFGSKGTEKPHTGWVDSVTTAGDFRVVNGEYGIKGDLTASGNALVDSDALLHIGGIAAKEGANIEVKGSLVLDSATGSQKINSEAGSVITVSSAFGRLDANGKDAAVAGTVNTQEGGTSLWHDMTVAVGGLNHVGNGGTEIGRYLTIDAGAKNAWVVDAGGKSTWETVANASGSNAGSIAVGTGEKVEGELSDKAQAQFSVAAGQSYQNSGTLDLTKAGNIAVEGAIITASKGESLYDDMTVGAEGSNTVQSGGSERGDILDLTDASENGWKVAAGGTSVWNEVIRAHGANDGSVTVGTGEKKEGELADKADAQFSVAEDDAYTNNGKLDLTQAGNVAAAGKLDTGATGESTFDDKTIESTGSSTVAGKESGDILDLTHGGRETVEETGSIHWNQILVGSKEGSEGSSEKGSGILENLGTVEVGSLIVEAGGQIRNEGIITGTDLTVGKDGVLELAGGETSFEKTTAEAGSVIVVGNGKDLSPDNKVAVSLDFGTAEAPVSGSIFVIGNGELNLGSNLDFDDAIKAPQLPDAASKLIVGKTVNVAATGSIVVGKDTWTPSSGDESGKANVSHGNGNLIFAKDSFTVIDVPGVGHGPAFKTDASGKTVTVEDGATLILGNVTESGDYVITDGFAVGSGPSGWLDEDHLYALSDGTGLDWILSLKTNPNQIIVNAAYSDIRTLYPDIVIPETVNDALKHSGDIRGAADAVLTEILKDKDGTVLGKTRTVNTLAQLAQAGGVFANNQDAMTSALNAVETRASFAGDVFNGAGIMAGIEKPTDLWAQLLTASNSADEQKSAGRMTGGYDADVTGIMAGLDHRIEGTQWRAGAALSYQKADIESTGDWDDVTTDAETFGIQGYAHFSPSESFNLIGSVGYFHSTADVDMALPWASKSFRKATASVSTDMVAAGLRAEGRFPVTQNIAVIPHAGVRFLSQSSGSYDTKADGAKLFSTKVQSSTTGQAPVGVAVRGDFDTAAGWTLKPWGDVTVMPQFGETQTKTTITAAGIGIPEEMTGDMTGHFVAAGTLGVIAEKGAFSAAASYGYAGGSDGRGDHAANVTLRYRF